MDFYRDWLRAILQVGITCEYIIFFPREEYYIVIVSFIHGVNVIDITGKSIPEGSQLHRILSRSSICVYPPEIIILEDPHLSSQ